VDLRTYPLTLRKAMLLEVLKGLDGQPLPARAHVVLEEE
jgi:hypothetical protein